VLRKVTATSHQPRNSHHCPSLTQQVSIINYRYSWGHAETVSIGVGTQPTLGQDIFDQNICMKNNKIPEFYVIFARKILFSRFFLEGGAGARASTSAAPSPTPMIAKTVTIYHGWLAGWPVIADVSSLRRLCLLVLSLSSRTEVIKDVVKELEGRSFIRDLFPAMHHNVIELLWTFNRTSCRLGHASSITYKHQRL